MKTTTAAVPKPVDDPECAPEPCPAAAGREKKKVWRRVLLVGSLTTLLLLACFVLGRESASSTAWLQLLLPPDLTATNNNGTAAPELPTTTTTANAPPRQAGRDELLGGLLPADMDRRSCRSRYKSWRYYKHFPYAASPYLKQKLRAYEARHRRCAPGTPLYAKALEQLRSGHSSSSDDTECRYVVWLPFDGLGNRMLSMVSGFLYALLTGRVFLVALPPDSGDLFCEPFPNATWRIPVLPADDSNGGGGFDFPVPNLVPRGIDIGQSYTRLLNAKLLGPATMANSTAAVPAYVYASLGYKLKDPLFFCGEHQRVIAKVNWVMLYSDLYFAPSLYAVSPEFRDELRRMFPAAMESVGHLLSRYLFHAANPVWSLVTRYHRSYLAPPASRRRRRVVGVQIRMFNYGSIPADAMFGQILNCSRQEHVLPEIDDDDNNNGGGGDHGEPATMTTMANGSDNNGDNNNGSDNSNSTTTTTAILVASLYGTYYERLRSRYYEHAAAAKGGGGGETTVAVFQPSSEGRQATGSLGHNQRALAEIYLLGFSDELLTSGRSTFGYVSSSLAGVRPVILLTALDHRVPQPPCRRAVSMEPCNLTPPLELECQGTPVDKEDLARHLRVCEDTENSVKLFD